MKRYIIMVLAAILAGCADISDMDSGFYEYDSGQDELTADAKSSISKTYHLPYMSGESYTASTYSGHGEAWDFNASGDCGEPVVAITDSVVSTAVSNKDSSTTGYGNYVRLNHDSDGYYSRYAHLDEVFVVSGQWVERGQVLGTIGSTGASTGCHIHFQVENSSGTSYGVKFKYYSGGKKSGRLSSGSTYKSYNNGKFGDARSRNGKSRVGKATSTLASRVSSDGFSKSYSGGSYGNCAIYYEALGCSGGDGCPSYNNTNYAWLVRTGFYNYYYSCGGPSSCSLGFPTGDEYSTSYGARQNFDNGYLKYKTSTGSVTKHSY